MRAMMAHVGLHENLNTVLFCECAATATKLHGKISKGNIYPQEVIWQYDKLKKIF